MKSAASRLFTTWVRSLDRVDHAVTDEECTARLIQNRVVFVAVCGAEFLPGPMESATGPQCPRCVGFLLDARGASQRSSESLESSERVRTRRSWLSRWAGRREPAADADRMHVLPNAFASAGADREVRRNEC
jgi:hypothetical protein